MDFKEFERLQQAVQTVADEDRINREYWNNPTLAGPEPRDWVWEQSTWGWGRTTEDTVHTDEGFGWTLVCGSGGCLAGTGVMQAGDRFVTERTKVSGALVQVDDCVDADGFVYDIEERASDLFGLEPEESAVLFSAANTATRIISLARTISAKYGHTLVVI